MLNHYVCSFNKVCKIRREARHVKAVQTNNRENKLDSFRATGIGEKNENNYINKEKAWQRKIEHVRSRLLSFVIS